MLEENKNLKDNSLPHFAKGKSEEGSLIQTSSQPSPYKGGGENTLSYTKINKLISALYMVTDIMDIAEPMRNRLRTLGVNVVSDNHPSSTLPKGKGAENIASINEILSLLDIASAVEIVSSMNYSILKKEFNLLKQSIHGITNNQKDSNWLEEFLISPCEGGVPEGQRGDHPSVLRQAQNSSPSQGSKTSRGESISIGHVGVQKGSTLLKALSNIEGLKVMENIKKSNRHDDEFASHEATSFHLGFDLLKKQRREEIVKIIKDCPLGATITDIKTLATGPLVSCGEKTLQRELVSMTHDGVLNKIGEKRWSKYSLK